MLSVYAGPQLLSVKWMNVFWISSLVILSTSAESIDNHIQSFLTGAHTCEIKHSYVLACWDGILLLFELRKMGPVSSRVCACPAGK